MKETSQSQWASRFRVEAAKVRQAQGRNDDVIRLLEKDSVGAITDPNLAVERLTILSIALARQRNTQRATQAILEAEALCNSTPSVTPFVRAELLAAKGRFALEEKHFPEAQALFQRSLAAARSGGNRFFEASALLNLSFIDLQEDHYEDALQLTEAATSIARTIGAEQLLKTSLGNAGWAYYETGDYQRALVSFNDAAESAASRGSTLEEEHWLNTAGMSEARLGRLDAARDHYDRALKLARSLKNISEIAQVDQALASLLLRTPHAEQAKKYIDEARALAQQEGNAFDLQLGDLLEAQFLARGNDLSNAKALLLKVERQTQQQFPTTHLEAQHTLAQVSEKSGDKQQAERWFKQSITTYREQRSQLKTDDARLPFFETGRDLYMDYVAFLVRNHRTDEALDVIDQGRAETLAEDLGFENKPDALRRISLPQLARQSHAVILVYSLSSPSSYLWASNGKQSGFFLLPDRSAILSAAAAHQRAVLAARDLIAEQYPAARTLYDMLVKPAEQLIHPGDRVYIVGAGGLSGLNFETLLTPGPSSHYWIEDVTITHFSSLRFLAMPRTHAAQSHQPSRLLIIGNPVYSGSQYSPLPNAATEVSDVASHFPATARTVLTGAEASPAAYIRSQPAHFDYIHFVSHATASRLVPLDSAVILSASGTQDSAKLYAREILNKPLNAELVTISSCQGSGVRTYAGEGLVGLAWAFLRAGSRNVIGALWDVSDASTPELMQHLYDGIAAGKPPDVSLRAAKLDLLHSRGVYRKPLYWGAFQLYSSGR